MKKRLLFLASVLFISLSACSQGPKSSNTEKTTTVDSNSDKVQVVYYHFTRRCMTCQAVEDEAKIAVEDNFKSQLENGTVSFASYNLDDDKDREASKSLNPTGQGLFVYKGDKVVNLTSQGFSNAVRNPDKFHDIIKDEVNKLL